MSIPLTDTKAKESSRVQKTKQAQKNPKPYKEKGVPPKPAEKGPSVKKAHYQKEEDEEYKTDERKVQNKNSAHPKNNQEQSKNQNKHYSKYQSQKANPQKYQNPRTHIIDRIKVNNNKPNPNGVAAMLGPAGGAGLVVLASVDPLFKQCLIKLFFISFDAQKYVVQ